MHLRIRYQTRNERASLILGAIAVLLGVLACAKVAAYHIQRKRVQGIAASAGTRAEPNDLQRCLEEARKAADELEEKNLFVKKPPREHPVKQVDGILGAEALISGKWYKVGAKIGDAKILEIGPTEVKIEWDGKEKTFTPMAAAGSGPSGPPARERASKGAPSPPRPATQAEAVKAEAPAAPTEDDPLAWMGVNLSPQVREKLLEHWNKLSDEEKEQRKQEWNEMDEGQKQQTIEALERM